MCVRGPLWRHKVLISRSLFWLFFFRSKTDNASLSTSTMTSAGFRLARLRCLCAICAVCVCVHASVDTVILQGMKYYQGYCHFCASVNRLGGAPVCSNHSSVCSSHFVALQVCVRRYGLCREGGVSILTLTVKKNKSTVPKKDIFF